VYPPRASPENQERAPGAQRPPPARPARPPAQCQPPGCGLAERRAVFPWFFLAVQVLFLVLVIAAALTADHGTAEAISHPAGQDLDPGLSPGLVAIAWVVADACLILGYGLYRLARSRR
jgi:hypothetical protein